jgi:hypothetical protein
MLPRVLRHLALVALLALVGIPVPIGRGTPMEG